MNTLATLRIMSWVIVCAGSFDVAIATSANAQDDRVRGLIGALQCKAGQHCQKVLPTDPASRKRGFSFKQITEVEKAQVEQSAMMGQLPTENIEVFFGYKSDQVTHQAAEQLDALGRALSSPELAKYQFVLVGHTDAKGGEIYNKTLSERRAMNSRLYLIEKFGIEPNRLVSYGRGKAALKNTQDPFAAENRRVQIINRGTINAGLAQ
jgi:outer membrane protein OmpA-like peptidoglycan-associated protein